jgi:hypothetical protein
VSDYLDPLRENSHSYISIPLGGMEEKNFCLSLSLREKCLVDLGSFDREPSVQEIQARLQWGFSS